MCNEYNAFPHKTRNISGAVSSAVNLTANPPSDISVQREYFLARLSGEYVSKRDELTKLYNLYIDNSPKSPKELIEMIEKKKFKLEDKYIKRVEEAAEERGDVEAFKFHSLLSFFKWDGPEPDQKGYDTACVEMRSVYEDVRDAIMAGDAAEMQKAVQTMKTWLPKLSKKN